MKVGANKDYLPTFYYNRAKLFNISEYYSKRGTGGEKRTGLGLIICKEFVEKQGVEIYVESNKEKASKFSFTLPVA